MTDDPTQPATDPPAGAEAPPAHRPAGPGGSDEPRRSRSRWWWVAGLAIAALVVVVLAPLASPDPDGLERVAEDQGWIETALDPIYSLIPDYAVPGLDGGLSTIAAGLIGVALVFAVMVGLGWLMRRRRTP